jgi:hypothetical protein
MNAPAPLFVSLRESRLILERLVQAAGVPAGLLPSVRDCALYSAALPGPGFAGMADRIAMLRNNGPAPLQIQTEAPLLLVDGTGQHAWFAAAGLLDLALEQFLRTGRGQVMARNLVEPAELRVVAGLAEAHGVRAEAISGSDGMILCVSARPATEQPLLDRIRRQGIAVEPETWWPLYHASHEALAPDSFESRRHAGTIRVEADGRVVGRHDEDETDLAMLAADPSRLRLSPASTPS